MVINRKSSECHKRTYIGNSSFVCAAPFSPPLLPLPVLSASPARVPVWMLLTPPLGAAPLASLAPLASSFFSPSFLALVSSAACAACSGPFSSPSSFFSRPVFLPLLPLCSLLFPSPFPVCLDVACEPLRRLPSPSFSRSACRFFV